MKTIKEAVKRLSKESLKEVSTFLGQKRSVDADKISALITLSNLFKMLSTLSMDELLFIKAVYSREKDLSFAEMAKILNIEVLRVERISKNLSRKLFVYVIKNRQLLTNKLDRIYGIEEIASILKISKITEIKDSINDTISNLLKPSVDEKLFDNIDDKEKKVLKAIAGLGVIIPFEDAESYIKEKNIDKILFQLYEKGLIKLFYVISNKFSAYISITPEVTPYLLKSIDEKESVKGLFNRFNFILNILSAFDSISTFGLFLTKQGKFRKIDIKRIMESMRTLYLHDGSELSSEDLSQLSLFILNQLNSLSLKKDIAYATLKELSAEIENPVKFTCKILNILKNPDHEDELFFSPMRLPDYNHLTGVFEIIAKLGNVEFNYLKTVSILKFIYFDLKKTDENDFSEISYKKDVFVEVMDLLSILGLIKLKDGIVSISDIGIKTAESILKITPKIKHGEKAKSIYINPDFTLIILPEELSSVALYHLLTHSDITQDDVTIHANISQSTVTRAHKRGMSLTAFVDALRDNSKNEIPQNLNFLLTEWANQAINISINSAILLKVSHESFIDDILLGSDKSGIVERISANYAIIDKEYIDEFVKIARKKDAVISLFEDKDL